MRHVRIFTRDGIRLHHVALLILVPAAVDGYELARPVLVTEALQFHKHPVLVRGHVVAFLVHEVQHHVSFLIYGVEVVPVPDDDFQLLSIIQDKAPELLAVLEAYGVEVDEEVDDGREEVLRRVGEERLRAAFLVSASLVERGKERGRRLRSRREVGYILALYGIDAVGVFHVGEVHRPEAAVRRQLPGLAVLAELVEERPCECRVLEVVHHHGEALGRVLADERVDDAEGLPEPGVPSTIVPRNGLMMLIHLLCIFRFQ